MSKLTRRRFMQAAGTGGLATTAAAIAAPAIAQTAPEISWRLAASWPKSLDTLFGGCEYFSKRVAEITDNRFKIQAFAAGEIVPGLQVLDAVQNGTVEMGNTAMYYYWGKDPAMTFGTALPFGLNSRQMNSWLRFGGGHELLNDLLKNYNCIGFAGRVLARLGVVAQQIPAGEIYPSLEKGTIDAAEWVGPYDDEKLGFHKVAPYYYYPGWWEGGTQIHVFINLERWNALPAAYKSIIRTSADMTNVWMTAKYDMLNPGALKRLLVAGAQLRPFPQPVLEACLKAANEVYAEISASNAEFKKIWEHILAFRNDQYLWWQVAEYSYDTFMIRSRPRGG